MMRSFQYFGFTHHDTPMELRDRIARAASENSTFIEALRQHGQFVLLSTCARFEVYNWGPGWRRSLSEPWLTRHLGLERAAVSAAVKTLSGPAVARHLLRVAAGLDSQIFGEDHIQAQVRAALKHAQQQRTCGAALEALWRAAICTGRRVRSETAISRSANSYARIAVDHIRGSLPAANANCVLIVGTGAMARETLRALRDDNQQQLAVSSHDYTRACELARRWHCKPLRRSEQPDWISRAHALITCTKSPGYVLTSDMLSRRRTRLHIVDLGVPRNVDPQVAHLPGVYLRNLDELSPCAALRSDVLCRAECIIDEQLQRLDKALRSMNVGARPSSRAARQELAA